MGRKPTSDAEKAAKGTLDKRWNEDARAKAGLAKVFALPTLRKIPKSTVPLGVDGQKVYDEWARLLFDAGRLTKITQQWIESFALSQDSIAKITAAGKIVPASVMTQRNRALGELKLTDVDPSLTPERQNENKFARNGFPGRRKTA